MKDWLNTALILTIILLCLAFLIHYMRRGRHNERKVKKTIASEKFTINSLVNYVRDYINEMTRTNLYELGLDSETFQRRINKRSELKKALKNCLYGSVEDKAYVKDFILDLLKDTYLNASCVDKVIPFDEYNRLTVRDKFDILLYTFKKRHGYDGLTKLIEVYHLDQLKCMIEDGHTVSYIISEEEIETIFKKERLLLSYEDKLNVIVQRVYQIYKGYGVIDEIRDMNIDGVSGGVSGDLDAKNLIRIGEGQQTISGYNSVWIFYKGKSIHLSFLSFDSVQELRRICQNIYRYNKAGQLSENVGYKVNEMKDGSRVVVVRPNFSESWAFFVRKFHIKHVTLNQLIKDKNSELPIKLITYLAKGCRVTAVTGAQGSGKTTLLMAFVRHIYATLTLRVQEMAFELHLRKVYPMRNILTFKETDTISGQQGLDIQKKTDGSVNILGEVATDPVAAWMIQMAQVASLFTVFTHHAKTVHDLVLSLRNSLLKCEVFNNEKVAEQQVVQVLNFDIHLTRDYSGKRYIERITEIIALNQDMEYPNTYKEAHDKDEKQALFMDTTTEYYRRRTDRKQYVANNILEYVNGQYVAKHKISHHNMSQMNAHMTEEDKKSFQSFIDTYWS